MFNKMQGEAIWKLSNKMPCLSAIKYLTRGTKCIQSDIPTKLQILHSYKFKDISKCNIIQVQQNEGYSFLVPCGKNKYLFSSKRNNSTFGMTPLVQCNSKSRPIGQLQELVSCYTSSMMFQVFKDAKIIKSMMSFPSMQQMCVHLSICKIDNPGQPQGELKIHAPIYGIFDKQGKKRNICTTETTDKRIEFCPPKKSKGEEDNHNCDSEEATVKTGAKGESKKECLTQKNQTQITFCAKGEDKNDLHSNIHMKASALSQESHCGQDDSKKECLMPKTQATQTFCADAESKNDLLSTTKTQVTASAASHSSDPAKADSKRECITPEHQETHTFCAKDENKSDHSSTSKTHVKAPAPAHSSHSVKCEGKNESPTPKGQSKSSAAQPAYCTKSESKKESKPKASTTQAHCTKSEAKSEPPASPKPQMKASSCSAPGAKGPDQKEHKPPKKEESKKEACGSKSHAKAGAQELKCSEKKPAHKEEAKKDPCGAKHQATQTPPPKAESKPCGDHKQHTEKKEARAQCPKVEEKKRVGCEPEPEARKCSAAPPTPDKKLKGNVPYPCPRMNDASKKKDKGGVPVWLCAMVSGIILLIAIIITWSLTRKEEKPELDSKGKPIKK